jgi:competence protein ComEC
MNFSILSFVVAVLLVPHLAFSVDVTLMWWGLLVVLPALVLPGVRPLAAFYLGLCVALAYLAAGLGARLPAVLAGQPLAVTGVISDLPHYYSHDSHDSHDAAEQGRGDVVRFRFRIESCDDCSVPLVLPMTVNLSRYHSPAIRPGERWHFLVRLQRPRGSANPGLFDYQGWLLAQGVAATGYVLSGERQGTSLVALHHQLRDLLRDRLQGALANEGLVGLLLALSLGESQQISPAQWRVLSATGTNHLFIISGLHVSLVAALVLRLLNWLLRGHAAGDGLAFGMGLLLVLGYGGIAGFGVPVQRALVMLLCASLLLLLRRQVAPLNFWLLALLAVNLLNPLASLAAGFWLSFGAVLVLLYGFAGQQLAGQGAGSWVLAMLRSQWLVFLGMGPLLLYFVAQLSGAAMLANLVAIPLVSLVLVPLLLLALCLALVSAGLAAPVLAAAATILHYLWALLTWLAELNWIHYAGEISSISLVLALLGVLVLLLPRGSWPRWPGCLLVLPMWLNSALPLAYGEAEITVLDVGQGLSVLVRTAADAAILYDAGPKFGERFDAGAQIVTPFMHRSGVSRLQAMIVSHNDMDHAGGVAAISANFTIDQYFYGESPDQQPAKGLVTACQPGAAWLSAGVQLRLLPVPLLAGSSANNQSCLLLVETQRFAVLIPGDIESPLELALLQQSLPRVDVLLAPHHGSRSSSHPAFLNRLQPGVIVVSSGYANRFGHPHNEVLDRYAARTMEVFNTATDGAVTLHLGGHLGGGLQISTARRTAPRIWYD